MTPELLTVKEAALYLGMKPSWLRASTVPKVRLPGRGEKRVAVRYSRTALDAWIRQHTVNPVTAPDAARSAPRRPARRALGTAGAGR